MEELINKVLQVIKGYRSDDMLINPIDYKHISRWINQFDEDDREFLLNELLHILPNSYLSKENTLRILSNEFETLRKDYGYDSVKNFLDETIILDCQKEDKSQKILLTFIKDILKEKYDYDIKECGHKKEKNWIYFDDVLASGGTFKYDLNKKILEFGYEDFKKSEINIIGSFFILHTWGRKNVIFALESKLNYKFGKRLMFYRVTEIDNNPYVHQYFNPDPKFNHVFPIKSDIGDKYLDYLENAYERDYELRNEKFAYRESQYPVIEEFYTSAENRNRYEQIILKKGIDIIYSINHSSAKSLRPLGMTPPSFKTLGTGSHFFTWRNISNTCPIIFWWEANGWYPLFPVTNRG